MQGERKRINFFFLRFQPCFQGRSSSYGGGKNRDHGDKPLNSPWYTSSSLPVTQSDYETRESRKQRDLLILRLAILGFKLNKKDCCLRSYRNILLLGRCTAFLLCFHIKSFVSMEDTQVKIDQKRTYTPIYYMNTITNSHTSPLASCKNLK